MNIPLPEKLWAEAPDLIIPLLHPLEIDRVGPGFHS
jgi:hypothetical protein